MLNMATMVEPSIVAMFVKLWIYGRNLQSVREGYGTEFLLPIPKLVAISTGH